MFPPLLNLFRSPHKEQAVADEEVRLSRQCNLCRKHLISPGDYAGRQR